MKDLKGINAKEHEDPQIEWHVYCDIKGKATRVMIQETWGPEVQLLRFQLSGDTPCLASIGQEITIGLSCESTVLETTGQVTELRLLDDGDKLVGIKI